MGNAGWELNWRKEEELSALSKTTLLLPSYDCHGHPELSGEEAHIVRGKVKSFSQAHDAQLLFFKRSKFIMNFNNHSLFA